jgi:predicted double-glycine peptidase
MSGVVRMTRSSPRIPRPCRIACVILVLLLSGCGARPTTKGPGSPCPPSPIPPARHRNIPNLIPVPMVRQGTNYTCGVAALQSILHYYGVSYREDVLARALHADPKEGTDHRQIERFARHKGFTVEKKLNMTLDELKAWVDRRIPALVLIQAWPDKPRDYSSDWDDGHYVVTVGYDDEKLYFMDPSTLGNYTCISLASFVERWHDRDQQSVYPHFGMAITRPTPRYIPDEILPLP